MAGNRDSFAALVGLRGGSVTFHREDAGVDCPCLSPEGFRSPKWHRDHPEGEPNPALADPPWDGINPPPCNEEGKQQVTVINRIVKGFVQPAQSTRATRMSPETLAYLFGEVQTDDHIGIFPVTWNGQAVDFEGWSQDGEDYLIYDGKRFMVVAWNAIPDPADHEKHHWEVGLRLIKSGRPVAA